ncbi:MAG TPA: hypothetical protein VMV84_03865 [Dehalococcoidales bacterium]|nr:hypothetical protein [Dehalococcoidales bacterium]
MPHVEFVNIEEARNIILRMAQRIEEPDVRPLLDEVQAEMKQFIHGMILTAIHTGLIQDTPERLEELRSKLIMALDVGFILGREAQ